VSRDYANFFIFCKKISNFFLFLKCATKQFMFESLPYEPRKIEATEKNLELIYEAARKGLKGDALALAAGMLPVEYRRLVQFDPIAEYAEIKGRADGEMEMAGVLRTAALNGDTKAALDILKHVHKWTAPQSMQIQVEQRISILAALEEAQTRVIEGQVLDASADLLSGRRTEADGNALESNAQERPARVRATGLPVEKTWDTA
jgi:hypothetical protein